MSASHSNNEPVLTHTISCHAWNGDRSKVAVCPNNSDIHIYTTNGKEDPTKWTREHTLTQHDHLVTAIDWAPKTNRILSCSQDRNAYVWTFDENDREWKPSLVLLRINRAAVCCKWSPQENKFAVGSGAKIVSICYFEKEHDWWIGKMIKRLKSTVLSVAWHPTDNTILAVASSDYRCRVFSAYLKGLDPKDQEKGKFGTCLADFSPNSWVHDVQFSPSGKYLAFASHNSTLTVVDYESQEETKLPYNALPATRLLFLNDEQIIIAGHANAPLLFALDNGKWTYKGICDHGQYKEDANKRSSVRSAFLKFQKTDSVGAKNIDYTIKTRHLNSINGLFPYQMTDGQVTKFTSSGVDGRILFWDAKRCVSEAQIEK